MAHLCSTRKYLSTTILIVTCAILGACSHSGSAAPTAGNAGSSNAVMTAAPAAASLVPYAGADAIVSGNPATMTATVHLIAGQGSIAKGFNFNGYANGDMHVRVPTGWKVNVSLTVAGKIPHSAIIVPFSERTKGFAFQAAFPGSTVADYRMGIMSGDPPKTFSFTATTAGKYAIVCGVPGHDGLGMWDEFDVVNGLRQPDVLVKK